MTKEDIEKGLEPIAGEIKAVKENLKSYASKKDIEDAVNMIEEKTKGLGGLEETLSELKEVAEKQGLELEKIANRGGEKESLKEVLKKQHNEIKDSIDRKGRFVMDVKTDVLTTSVTNHTLAYREPNVGQIATRRPAMRDFFRTIPVGANSNGVVRYVDQSSITRNAAEVAEAGVIPESAIAWQEYTLNLEKIGDSIPVSREMIEDVDFVDGELRRLLDVNIALREDSQLYSGNGTPPNITGAYTYATTFSASAAGIVEANLYDLILKVQEVINSGKESKYQANTAFVSYTDWNAILSKKASDGHYVKPEWAQISGPNGGGITVNGIRVVPSSLVTANTMLLCDSAWGTIYDLDGYRIEMGYVNDQFTKDMMTFKATKRMAFLVRNVDATAFYKVTDIDAALLTLAS